MLCSGGGGGQFNLDRLDGDEKENQEDAREWSLTRNDQDLRIERSSVYLSVHPTSGSERVIMTMHFDATQKCISLIDIDWNLISLTCCTHTMQTSSSSFHLYYS